MLSCHEVRSEECLRNCNVKRLIKRSDTRSYGRADVCILGYIVFDLRVMFHDRRLKKLKRCIKEKCVQAELVTEFKR